MRMVNKISGASMRMKVPESSFLTLNLRIGQSGKVHRRTLLARTDPRAAEF